MIKDVVLAGGVRTALGGFLGSLAGVPAPQLGGLVMRAAMQRAGVAPQAVDEVIAGNVLPAGLGQNVGRQAALAAGLAPAVGATTVNKVCGSSLKAVMLAAQAVQCGDAEVVLAAGMENMSQAPYLLPKARTGYRMGHGEIVDSMIHDGLWDVYNKLHMGACGDRCAEKYGFSRQEQDDFAVASYRRALKAQSDGTFAGEIVAVEIGGKKGTSLFALDEEPQRFNEEKLRKLGPAFGPQGTTTAGNASSISDGAAAIVVAAGEKARQLGLKAQARILGYSTQSQEPEWFSTAPIGAIAKLMSRLGWQTADVDLFEINEAFSVVPMAAMKELQIPHEKINVLGGAVALGHPIGASGARVLVTLLSALALHKAARGIASLCIGGGEAVALAVDACKKAPGPCHMRASVGVGTGTQLVLTMMACRYVERNALTAGAVDRAEAWRWGSLWARRHGNDALKAILSDWPMERPSNWVRLVNKPMTEKEVERIRTCIARNRPYGNEAWQEEQAKRLGLLHTMRSEGRPKAIGVARASTSRYIPVSTPQIANTSCVPVSTRFNSPTVISGNSSVDFGNSEEPVDLLDWWVRYRFRNHCSLYNRYILRYVP